MKLYCHFPFTNRAETPDPQVIDTKTGTNPLVGTGHCAEGIAELIGLGKVATQEGEFDRTGSCYPVVEVPSVSGACRLHAYSSSHGRQINTHIL